MSQPVLFIIPGACSLGSMISLEWLDIPYQIGITTPEIRATPNFRKVNPTGKVGALKDDDIVVGENLAILLYLVDKNPNSSIGFRVGAPERVKMYQWLSYLSSTLHPAFSQVRFPGRFVSTTKTEDFQELAIQRLIAVLSYIESSFLASGLLIADHPTAVDAQAYGLLRWIRLLSELEISIKLEDYPSIAKFMTIMEQLPAVQNALAIENQEQVNNSKFNGYFNFN